jgi:hypothetical protein
VTNRNIIVSARLLAVAWIVLVLVSPVHAHRVLLAGLIVLVFSAFSMALIYLDVILDERDRKRIREQEGA